MDGQLGGMSPDAVEACALQIERLTSELQRWRDAYQWLAGNRMTWIDGVLKRERLTPSHRRQIVSRLKARLRKW